MDGESNGWMERGVDEEMDGWMGGWKLDRCRNGERWKDG